MAVCGHPVLYDSSYRSKLYSGNKHFKLCLLVIWLTDLTQHEFRLFTRWHYEVLISASSWSFNCIRITEKSLRFGFILMWFSVIFIFAMLISRTITKKGYRFEPLSQTTLQIFKLSNLFKKCFWWLFSLSWTAQCKKRNKCVISFSVFLSM